MINKVFDKVISDKVLNKARLYSPYPPCQVGMVGRQRGAGGLLCNDSKPACFQGICVVICFVRILTSLLMVSANSCFDETVSNYV